jgi:hypothetical protein
VTGQRIEEYQILYVSGAGELARLVTENIKDGWQPFGNIIISPGNSYWAQAMVKYKAVAQRSLTNPLSVTKRE